MIDGNPLVSVVVPAFNAAKTIRETLHSISQQTYRNLEVIVVDDGSTDETAAIARRHSMSDPRFRIVSKTNGGVASARNEGIRASKGEFIAFIDADDLWHPTKIAKQIELLLSGGPEMALVYCPFRSIDAAGKVLASPQRYAVSGWVLHRHFHTNLVGNGSAILIRKSVLEEIGGFDPWLRSQGAEGCEDLLLQLRVAARYQFGEVFEYLVGYRRHPEGMSSNRHQMIHSGLLAVTKALSECRDVPHLSASAMLWRYEWKRLKHEAKRGRLRDSLRDMFRHFVTNPGFVIAAVWEDIVAFSTDLFRAVMDPALHRLRSRSSDDSPRHFYDFDPTDIHIAHDSAVPPVLRRLSRLDQAFRPRANAINASSLQGPSKGSPTPPTRSDQRGRGYPRKCQEG